MNISDFYLNVGGDYQDVITRLISEKMIVKFVKKFADDTSYNELIQAYSSGDAPSAFRAAHTLKGVCSTLSLGALYKEAFELTEALRNATIIDYTLTEDCLKRLKQQYTNTIENIKKLD